MLNSENIKSCLDKLLSENDRVFIVPHNRPDMDALGASIGMALICKKNKKRYFIVIDDDVEKLESATRKVIEDISTDFEIIKVADIPTLLTDKSLMIAVDVNKDYLISTKKYLDDFNDIFVLDHHKTDEHTIKTNNIFVDDKLSSTCEEVSRQLFLNKIKINKDNANYLLAGIILDTNKMSKDTVTASTYDVAARLNRCGASAAIANNMFLEDFEHDRAIQRLVDNTMFPTYIFAIASDKEDSGKIYDIEDIAKASDYLLKYQVNATFAIAYIDNDTVSISARSKGIIDVSKIMKLFGGGGNEHSAAARVKGMHIDEIKKTLCNLLIPANYYDYLDVETLNGEEGMTLNLTKKVEKK
ncbi:MAG: DHH family phosphoesterase [Bacilli bacterium]|nr:DHH family phosphoesterase [Bacilli bacterium]